jgi:hypothetical protein
LWRFLAAGKFSWLEANARSRAASRDWEAIMIKKVSGGYKVVSKKGKNMGGPYKSKAAAEKRLKQVEFFKRNKG